MKLIAVTDDKHTLDELARKIVQIKDVVDFIHIREKSKTVLEIVSLLKFLEECKVDRSKIVINDRLDIALMMNYSNVHLPSHGLPVKWVKDKFDSFQVGRSVHSLVEANEVKREGADYVLYGHCYETNSKIGKTPNGIGVLSEIKEFLKIPVIAIGGITPNHVEELKQINIDGIAVMSGIFSSDNPYDSAKKYLERCKESL
jgi:thiazole tautomerase (transcriptional regulator TenI)